MTNILKTWLAKATTKEAEQLASLSETTLATLRQLAGGYRTDGVVRATPATARRIEIAARKVGEGLPAIKREDLCPACKRCEYQKQAKKP